MFWTFYNNIIAKLTLEVLIDSGYYLILLTERTLRNWVYTSLATSAEATGVGERFVRIEVERVFAKAASWRPRFNHFYYVSIKH